MIMNNEEIPIRSLYMLSSRFSGKTFQIEEIFKLLFIQQKKKIVMNYIRARGEDVFKTMDKMEKNIKDLTNGNAYLKSNIQRKALYGSKNKINFAILNEIKEKVQQTGGKIGLPIEFEAEYIITFFEEASQLDRELVQNFRQSVRGNANTKMIFIYASNPWIKQHWFMKDFSDKLPETKIYENQLIEKGYNAYYEKETKSLYFRPRWTLNPFVQKEQQDEIEQLKNVNYNKWRIVSLGFSGATEGTLYQNSLKKLCEDVFDNFDGRLLGGVDWGDGKSKTASPTTAYISMVSLEHGIHILDEYEYFNNQSEYLSTEEQLIRVCKFFIKWYDKYKKPITVHIDNAALGDFFKMVQSILSKLGYGAGQIEFLPAFKPKNTFERVETLNVLLSLGILRFKKDVCPKLYEALDNCYEVIKTNPTEEMKRQRSHEWTHWIHAVEYMIADYFKHFQEIFPILIETKSLEGKR